MLLNTLRWMCRGKMLICRLSLTCWKKCFNKKVCLDDLYLRLILFRYCQWQFKYILTFTSPNSCPRRGVSAWSEKKNTGGCKFHLTQLTLLKESLAPVLKVNPEKLILIFPHSWDVPKPRDRGVWEGECLFFSLGWNSYSFQLSWLLSTCLYD